MQVHRQDRTEDRHHNQPAIRKLVVTYNCVTVIPFLAHASKSRENCVCRYGTVKHGSGVWVARAFFCEHRKTSVYNLHDVIWADREAVIGGIAVKHGAAAALRAFEAIAETVEAFDGVESRALALGRLFDGRAGSGDTWDRRG